MVVLLMKINEGDIRSVRNVQVLSLEAINISLGDFPNFYW